MTPRPEIGEIRFFRLVAVVLTASIGLAILTFCAGQQIAHLFCGPQINSYTPHGTRAVEILLGAMFLACAWVQWTFLETGIVLTPSRLFFSAASIFYLIEFIPGFATLTSYCYGEMWHDFGEVQATMAMIFFLLLLAVVAPLSAGVYAVSEWNRGKGA